MNAQRGWIGCDLDGTVARYTQWKGISDIGEPVPKMLERLKAHLAAGDDVRILTARVWPNSYDHNGQAAEFDGFIVYDEGHDPDAACAAIQAWCVKHLGRALAVTCRKDYNMLYVYDDRAIQIEGNTGRRMDGAE